MLDATTALNTTASTTSMLEVTTTTSNTNTTMLGTTILANTTTSPTNMNFHTLELHTLSLESSSEDEERSESSEEDSEQSSEEMEQRHYPVRIGDDLRLQSGKILSHRSHARQSRHHHYKRQQPHISSFPSPSTASHLSTETINLIISYRPSYPSSGEDRIEPPSHSLVARKGTETSLLGVPEKQQRAMLAVAKKMEASAARTMNEFQAGLERKGNCQKTFRVKSIGKKAGGLEKRLG